MDGAAASLQKQLALEQLASAFCRSTDDDEESKSYVDFQATDEEEVAQAPAGLSFQEKDTLRSVVDQCQRLNRHEKSNVHDNTKLLAEASRTSKVQVISVSCGERHSSIKRRLKWTADLHQKFVHCVNLLGGPEKATPRAILKIMKSNGLTVLHVKSHLQKYRYATCITGSTQGKPDQQVDDDGLPMLYFKSGMQVMEILKMQLQVERHLCQQLKIQQNLQQGIEEQGKQIQMMLEQLKKTNEAC